MWGSDHPNSESTLPQSRRVDPDQVANALGEAFAREFGSPPRLPLQAILFEATRP
jgi:hypothetical protein